jgi:hypothetical protein
MLKTVRATPNVNYHFFAWAINILPLRGSTLLLLRHAPPNARFAFALD